MQDTSGNISPLHYWCQKILPAVYDDSLSYYELLAKVVEKLNELVNTTNLHSDLLVELRDDLEELNELFEQFKQHGFDDYYKAQVERWIDTHLQYIYTKVCKQVYFGLTLDGYFVAHIPDGWSDIIFDTGAVYGTEGYGRLILKYNVENAAPADQNFN